MPKLINIDFINAFKEGREEGFTYFFNLLYKPLCFFARGYTNDMQEAEDIVGDSLIKLWAKREIFENEQGIKNYLYRSVYNACLRSIENQERYKKHHDKYKFQQNASEQACINNIIKAETISLVHKAINQLPAQCQKVFTKLYIEGKSITETAQEMDLTISTIKNQKARGLKLLKPKLTN
jgi:RNA polymerase sigma-70 factor (ECF subfamily)